jgi:hypothetical protein
MNKTEYIDSLWDKFEEKTGTDKWVYGPRFVALVEIIFEELADMRDSKTKEVR